MVILDTLLTKLRDKHWSPFPTLIIANEVLGVRPDIALLVKTEVEAGLKKNGLGRGDSPSVEEVVRLAIYKEVRGVDYRELARHLKDSRICGLFTGIELSRTLEKSALQAYISKISASCLEQLMVSINEVAISWGIEDLSEVRGDTTVVQTPIHYPTNASLVWDCIKSATRVLSRLDAKYNGGVKKKIMPSARRGRRRFTTKLM